MKAPRSRVAAAVVAAAACAVAANEAGRPASSEQAQPLEIICVAREGIKSVNGKPLLGEKARPENPRPRTSRGEPSAVSRSSPPDASGPPPAGESGVEASSPPGEAHLPPITRLEKITPRRSAFEGSSWKKPLLIKSWEEAARQFDGNALARLKKQVDFRKQFVLLFAWRGSGQDRLDAVVAESYPEQIFFNYTAGRTRDLREHARVFALRSNVKWNVKTE